MTRHARLLSLVALAGFLCSSAPAAVVVTVSEQNGDTTFSAEGTLNLSGLTSSGGFTSSTASIDPLSSSFTLGRDVGDFLLVDSFSGLTDSPSSFGSGGTNAPTSGVGDRFGLFRFQGEDFLLVPDGFTGGSINSSSTFIGQDLTSLGIAPGTYEWAWGSGADADSITLNVVAIPEPSSILLLSLAGTAIVLRRARTGRNRRAFG